MAQKYIPLVVVNIVAVFRPGPNIGNFFIKRFSRYLEIFLSQKTLLIFLFISVHKRVQV